MSITSTLNPKITNPIGWLLDLLEGNKNSGIFF